MEELQIVYLSPHDLTPYEGNARKHTQADVEQIKESIRVDGFNDPIGIWGDDNLIVEGHGRQLAAIELGLNKVPCIRLDHMTDAQRRDYAIRHNRTAELSGWEWAQLEKECEALDLEGFDTGDLFNFEAKTAEWFDREQKDGKDREDGNDEYNDFVEKFEPKKTTDDCYTPEVVYDAIAEWVENRYGVKRSKFMRPFYPGGDYTAEEYKPGSVVVDNPPVFDPGGDREILRRARDQVFPVRADAHPVLVCVCVCVLCDMYRRYHHIRERREREHIVPHQP